MENIKNFIINTEDDKQINIITHLLEPNTNPKAVIIHIHGFLQDFNDDLPNHNTHLYLFKNRIKAILYVLLNKSKVDKEKKYEQCEQLQIEYVSNES